MHWVIGHDSNNCSSKLCIVSCCPRRHNGIMNLLSGISYVASLTKRNPQIFRIDSISQVLYGTIASHRSHPKLPYLWSRLESCSSTSACYCTDYIKRFASWSVGAWNEFYYPSSITNHHSGFIYWSIRSLFIHSSMAILSQVLLTALFAVLIRCEIVSTPANLSNIYGAVLMQAQN